MKLRNASCIWGLIRKQFTRSCTVKPPVRLRRRGQRATPTPSAAELLFYPIYNTKFRLICSYLFLHFQFYILHFLHVRILEDRFVFIPAPDMDHYTVYCCIGG